MNKAIAGITLVSVESFIKTTPHVNTADNLIQRHGMTLSWNLQHRNMQHRSFRIDDILAEDTHPTKKERKEEIEMTVVRRPPILLPRIEPIVLRPCLNNCCHLPSNCGRVCGETKAYLPPWYYNRNAQGFPGNTQIFNWFDSLRFLSCRIRICIGLMYSFSLKLFITITGIV